MQALHDPKLTLYTKILFDNTDRYNHLLKKYSPLKVSLGETFWAEYSIATLEQLERSNALLQNEPFDHGIRAHQLSLVSREPSPSAKSPLEEVHRLHLTIIL